jgi:hypothetical protein
MSQVASRFGIKERIIRSKSPNLLSELAGKDSFQPSVDSSVDNQFGILLDVRQIPQGKNYGIIAFEGVDESLIVTEIDFYHIDYGSYVQLEHLCTRLSSPESLGPVKVDVWRATTVI